MTVSAKNWGPWMGTAILGLLGACGGGGASPFDDARINSDASVVDAPIIGNCEVRFPGTAFVQDRLNSAPGFVIQRGALRVANMTRTQTPPGPQTQPAPAPMGDQNLRRPAPAEDGGTGGIIADPAQANCGFEAVAGFAWDGHRCRGVSRQYCQSQTCTGLAPTAESCAAANATCEPELCRASGGQWSEVPLSCATWENGAQPAIECRSLPRAQCICPPNQSPRDGRCVASESPLSAAAAGCLASGGIMAPACGGFQCGQDLLPCVPSAEACNCGPNRNFNPDSNRCEISAACDQTPRTLCEGTGGRWEMVSCVPHVCGVVQQRLCQPTGGCNCGALGIFDETLGCLLAPRCRTNACF